MHWPYDDWGAWHIGWMMIGWVVGLVLVGVLVLFAVRTLGYGPERPRSDEAKRILRERYARGEIDENELHRRMDELGGTS